MFENLERRSTHCCGGGGRIAVVAEDAEDRGEGRRMRCASVMEGIAMAIERLGEGGRCSHMETE